MILAFVLGFVTTAAIALAAVTYHRAPTRIRCPECGSRTQAVLPRPGLRLLTRWLVFRWCPVCTWEGVGRVGPERIPGRPAAHASGFHWNPQDLAEDLGFQWATREASAEDPSQPPDHPSGFRFAPHEPTGPVGRPAHPSGFTWARPVDPEVLARARPADPSGFRWGTEPYGHIFRWKADDTPRSDGTAA